MASRKDNKGRVLRTGESQRKDGIYVFRYFDANKNRHCVYANTLNDLRAKEAKVQENYAQGTSYAEGGLTVLDLIKRYLGTKNGLSYNTERSYFYVVEKLKSSSLAYQRIRDVKTSDAKHWITTLHKQGLGYGSLNQIKGVMSPAFDLAVEDEILNKNPFSFSLSKVVPQASSTRMALTYRQQKELLEAFREHPTYNPRYDLINIMLGTGLRIGEVTGLTMNDIDMEKRTINVNHQLLYNYKRGLYVTAPKTEHGYRIVPMSKSVYESFKSAIEDRRFITDEPEIDGYSGFIFLTKRGTPDYASLVQTALVTVVRDYNRNAKDPLPHVTPHVLRHTFCTNLVDSGVNIKQVQYLMGHSKANVTMNVYAHVMLEKSDDALVETLDDISKKLA